MHNLQKSFIAALFLLLSAFLFSVSHAEPAAKENGEIQKVDRIVAVVDQAVITEKELTDRIRSVTAQLEKQGTELPPPAILEKQILERMITDKLQLQLS